MVINIALILLLLGSGKMKLRPYLAAVVLGLIRAVIAYLLTHNTETAVISGVMYIVLGFAVVYFFQAVLRSDAAAGPEPANYTAAGTQTVKFKWQYIPLVASLLLLLLGERVMVYLLRALA